MGIRKSLINRLMCLLIAMIFFTGISNLLYGDELPSYEFSNKLQLIDKAFLNPEPILYQNNRISSFDFNENEYKESSFRRFEIIFFISLPISFMLTIGGTLLYKEVSSNKGSFSGIEYSYLIFSSVGISISVALRDYFIMKKKIVK